MNLFLLNILLALAWGTVTGAFTFVNLAFGFLVGGLAIVLIRGQIGQPLYLRRLLSGALLGLIFVVELVKSSVRVAVLVLSRDMKLRPAIIAYPLTVRKDYQITLLANLITLTPGTLSIDVSDDRSTLYIHSLDVPDVDALILEIRNTFERRIRETFR